MKDAVKPVVLDHVLAIPPTPSDTIRMLLGQNPQIHSSAHRSPGHLPAPTIHLAHSPMISPTRPRIPSQILLVMTQRRKHMSLSKSVSRRGARTSKHCTSKDRDPALNYVPLGHLSSTSEVIHEISRIILCPNINTLTHYQPFL